jgi:hypothetical protein
VIGVDRAAEVVEAAWRGAASVADVEFESVTSTGYPSPMRPSMLSTHGSTPVRVGPIPDVNDDGELPGEPQVSTGSRAQQRSV